MRMRGLEPPRGFPHTDLNRARLPIPPHPRGAANDDSNGSVAKLDLPEPPSSRGLGRRPLTAETGVRIPVAVLRSPHLCRSFVSREADAATASALRADARRARSS